MRNRRSMNSRVSVIAFAFLVFFSFFPGYILSALVTLKSIKLYTTHKWIEKKPGVYFACTGENKTFLPDVKAADVLYKFKGEESWQPLTELKTKKCKRCGVYEDLLGSDHTFDEWELCSSDFDSPDAHYTHFKAKEVNATFLCEECASLGEDPPQNTKSSDSAGGKGHYAVSILITIVVVVLVIVLLMALYKCWQKRKRQRDQARFLKLFEEDDDMDDELGLREMM